MLFDLVSDYKMAGDQPEAAAGLLKAVDDGADAAVLWGVTGSGKTFTLANVISKLDRPVLVLSHNKTLAMQLHAEFKTFFPHNAVEFFISYYDYYLPESYIPQTDTYIAKDCAINDNIERLRLSTTASLMERRDVIVVASVSCIYGLGSPGDFNEMCLNLFPGKDLSRAYLIEYLVGTQYERNDFAPEKGQFRVRGDVVDVFLMQRDGFIRVHFFGDTVEKITTHDETTGKQRDSLLRAVIFPRKNFVVPPDRMEKAFSGIREELKERIKYFNDNNLLIEAQRIEQRTEHDLEMLKELGYCTGIENYSRYLSDRAPGSRPYCLLDFFPKDFLTIIDESHVTIPQLQAMYKADASRKGTLVEHGFRLPSARENRPLTFDEFMNITGQTLYVSATPAPFELGRAQGRVIEQLLRPTGLLDPQLELHPIEGQIDDALEQVRKTSAAGMRSLITTLTKKNSERLAEYLKDLNIKVTYLHSEIDALERTRILNELRNGDFECVVGINLLREGIDLPEVGLVCILDADKEGFLRSERALVQVAGRAARNANGRVVLYADTVTPAIQGLLDITMRRRRVQMQYNEEHHITPQTIHKSIRQSMPDYFLREDKKQSSRASKKEFTLNDLCDLSDKDDLIINLQREMLEAADALEFERAAVIRDQIKKLENNDLETHTRKRKR